MISARILHSHFRSELVYECMSLLDSRFTNTTFVSSLLMNINCVMGTLLGNLSGASCDVINIHKLSNESVRGKIMRERLYTFSLFVIMRENASMIIFAESNI